MIYLDVKYSEKEEVKGLLARWDGKKKWYSLNRNDYSKFTKWISGHTIFKDYV